MHINLEKRKKIYYNIDIYNERFFESQRFVYKLMNRTNIAFVKM